MVLLAAGSTCPAATPPARENAAVSGELRFRRVYFPEGTQAWPKGNEKYLPMDGAEFERLLAAIQHTTTGALPQASVGFVAAQYEARLKGQTLQGSATLDVSPAIASAMLMNLDPCNLAIARAQWVTSDGAPAVLGITGDGKLQVLAERGTGAPSTLGRTGSGQVKFDWSLAGQADAAGGVNFAIALPPSPVNRMAVELPAGLTPTVDRGIVSDAGPMDADFHRFRLDLGGRPGCRLRLAKAGSRKLGRKRFWPARRRPTTFRSAASSCRSSLRSNPTASRCGGSRWVSIRPWNWSRFPRAACPSPGAWRIRRTNPGRQPSRFRRRCRKARRNCGCARLPPLTMAGSWKLPRLDVRGRRLPVEHDPPLGAVAPVHRAPGNARMPADRRVALDDDGGRATGLYGLRGRCRDRCFPFATSRGGAGPRAPRRPSWAKAR